MITLLLKISPAIRLIAAVATLAVPPSARAATIPELPPSGEGGFFTVPLAADGDIKVRLRVKRDANPADVGWLGLQFINGGAAVGVDRASYRISRLTIDRRTGRGLWTGSLSSGATGELFPETRGAEPAVPPTLKPGVHIVTSQPSDYGMALLKMPPPGGLRVEARAEITLRLKDGRTLSTPPKGTAFSFDWVPPDGDGIAALRVRLLQLVAETQAEAEPTYVLSLLLQTPEVETAVTVEELLAGLKLRGLTEPHGRNYIVQSINRRFPTHPKVIDHFLAGLSEGDWRAAGELGSDAADVWDDRFLPLLLRMHERTHAGYGGTLHALRNHAARWKDDADYTARLSAAVLRARPIPPIDQLAKLDQNARLDLSHVLYDLALTRDRDAVRHLRPLLDATTVLYDPLKPTFSTGVDPTKLDAVARSSAPVRACDAAAATIYQLLGREREAKAFFHQGETPAGSPPPKTLRAYIDRDITARDEKIRLLRDALSDAAPAAQPAE